MSPTYTRCLDSRVRSNRFALGVRARCSARPKTLQHTSCFSGGKGGWVCTCASVETCGEEAHAVHAVRYQKEPQLGMVPVHDYMRWA